MGKISKKFLIILLFLFITCCSNKRILQYRNFGIDYLNNKNYEEALNYFNQAIVEGDGEIGPIQYDLLMYKAHCLYMLKRYEECKNIYETLLLIDKNNRTYKDLYENVSSVVDKVLFSNYLNNGEIEKADEIFRKLKEQGLEHEKSVMFNQGVLYEKKGEWKDALNAFNYYLKQYPNDEKAIHEIEFINSELNDVYN
jgi:pentatricopeptide repeat protein